MTNKNIYIMIGLPGSGKSTYVNNQKSENDIVLSSDLLRKEIFGDETNQSNNGFIFTELFSRFETALKQKLGDIYIDTTSVSAKERRKIFVMIKKYNKAKVTRVGEDFIREKTYKVTGISFRVKLEEVLKRDEMRERNVGKRHILRIFSRYAEPVLSEGFDEIKIISDGSIFSSTFKNELLNYINGGDNLETILSNSKYLVDMLDCEQTSLYHRENLKQHLTMILDLIQKDYENNLMSKNDYKLHRLITLFHDMGKPFVKNTKKSNLERRGYKYLGENRFEKKDGEIVEVDNYDDFQFLGHEVLSANIYNLDFKDYIVSENIVTKQESSIIEIVIKGHLLFHKIEDNYIKIENKIYKQDTEVWRIGTRFSYYDSMGRVA